MVVALFFRGAVFKSRVKAVRRQYPWNRLFKADSALAAFRRVVVLGSPGHVRVGTTNTLAKRNAFSPRSAPRAICTWFTPGANGKMSFVS